MTDQIKMINNFLKKLLKPNDTIVVACSGGPDSMVLCDLLLKQDLNLHLILAHVNHGLRKQSEEEAAFVKNYAKEHNCQYAYLKIEEYAEGNFHDVAHNLRYQFFEETLQKYQANYLMTAHHGDDLMETILMRLARGSSLRGYSGIKLISQKTNYQLIRPLLFITKDNILKYLTKNNLKYYLDESNTKPIYTRNRYRQNILPFLKEENPNIHLKYLEFSQELEETENYVDKEVINVMNECYEMGILDLKKLLKKDKYLIKKVIFKILSNIYKDDLSKLTKKHQEEVLDLIYSAKPNLKIDLPNNNIVIKEYNKVVFLKNISTKDNNFKYILEDEVILNNGDKISIIKDSQETSNDYLYLNSQEIKLPLIIRSRKEADKMAVKNLNGHKKVKDILIDSKISKRKREEFPIVTDSNDIVLWLPGIKKSKFDRAKTKNYDIILKYTKKKENIYGD